MSEDRLKIAVFIDFDNIEIGVKTTLNARFDVGGVLEAIKERGEIVAKSAYGDWTRATEYGRSMSQHAIHMVQRNLTPGGDKNGADINLALDALEMAFTHNHINAFVIVGGDSDFITLVEKLKQYDRKVFVVGGRAFTSHVMQRNCTEFIAYEDITGVTGSSGRGGRQSDRGGRAAGETNLAAAMPLLRRALKLLADREVVPQLGLLKSTLLQLDSTFSERAYGVSSFRDFVQKLAKAGYVTLKGADRSFHVELREAGEAAAAAAAQPAPQAQAAAVPPAAPKAAPEPGPAAPEPAHPPAEPVDAIEAEAVPREEPASPAEAAGGPPRLGPVEGFRTLLAAFTRPGVAPRFPMYVRQVKQFVRQVDDSFDERKYGFSGMIDVLRFGQREGLFRLDRDRQGVVRVYPGLRFPRPGGAAMESADAQEHETPAGQAAAAESTPFESPHISEDLLEPEAGAETATGGQPDADIESVTYDVVTRVDADSGVIDVARHEDAPHEPAREADAAGAADATGQGSPQPPARGRKPRRPAGSRPRGRQARVSTADAGARHDGDTGEARAAHRQPDDRQPGDRQPEPPGADPGAEAKPASPKKRGGGTGDRSSRRRRKAPGGQTPAQ